MEIAANSPSREITIQGIAFKVSEPFAEGHVLKANEASVLNQTFAENIRNNCATMIESAKKESADKGTELNVGALQEAIDKYIAEYEFGANRGGSRTVDPVRREALTIAEAKVRDALKKKNVQIKSVGAERIREMAEQALAKFPAIMEQARAVVEARRGSALDIDLS